MHRTQRGVERTTASGAVPQQRPKDRRPYHGVAAEGDDRGQSSDQEGLERERGLDLRMGVPREQTHHQQQGGTRYQNGSADVAPVGPRWENLGKGQQTQNHRVAPSRAS